MSFFLGMIAGIVLCFLLSGLAVLVFYYRLIRRDEWTVIVVDVPRAVEPDPADGEALLAQLLAAHPEWEATPGNGAS